MAYRGSLYAAAAVKSLVLFYAPISCPSAAHHRRAARARRRLTDRRAGRSAWPTRTPSSIATRRAARLRRAVFDADGNLTVATPEAVRALEFARSSAAPTASSRRGDRAAHGHAVRRGEGGHGAVRPVVHRRPAARVPWAVAPLPIVSATGKPAAPFSGRGRDDVGARGRQTRRVRVMDFLTATTPRSRGPRRPAGRAERRRVPGCAHRRDPVLAALRAQAGTAVPMPSQPAMRRCGPVRTAIQKVIAREQPRRRARRGRAGDSRLSGD